MSSLLLWEEVRHPAERSRSPLPRGMILSSSLDCPRTASGLGPHQDLPAMGHFEEHWEAISANEQVAGSGETSPGSVREPWYQWENK